MNPGNKRVLVVDDAEAIREVLSIAFRQRGCETILAGDGRQAVQQAAKYIPHLVLMDICMPEMDGYHATRCIHEVPHLASVPVIAMSSLGDRDWFARAIAAGCVEALRKPVDPEKIDQLVNRYVDGGVGEEEASSSNPRPSL
jgi:CheY-like chemotaxis protein